MTLNALYKKAISLGATDLGFSDRRDKRFYVIYGNKIIHFGSKNGKTYIDHHDEAKRTAWRSRHSKIVNSEGIPFYTIKTSPEFWNWNLTW